jgi:hypothetical protein
VRLSLVISLCLLFCLDIYFRDPARLLDIVHADQKLYLVFEFLDVDLKRYMENGTQNGDPIQLDMVKVSEIQFFLCSLDIGGCYARN